MQLRAQMSDLFRRAANEAKPLVELTENSSTIDPWTFAPSFQGLRDGLASLPIPQETYALLNNMVSDAESLIERRELGAARWQLIQTIRRLDRLQDDWSRDSGSAGGHSCGDRHSPSSNRGRFSLAEPVTA